MPNPKDKPKEEDRSGIYKISWDNCNKKYIGQTKRKIHTRFKEHFSNLKLNHPEKSAIAQHCLEESHSISKQNLKLLKSVNKPKYLNAWETFYINLEDKNSLLNIDDGPIQNSQLLKPHMFLNQLTPI